MISNRKAFFLGVGLALALTAIVYAVAAYPSAVVAFPTRVNGQTIDASWFNDLQAEVVAIENGLLNGLSHHLKATTDNTYDLGQAGSAFRDLALGRNITFGGSITPNITATGDLGTSVLKLRDGFFSRDVAVGRNLIGPPEFNAGNSGAAITIDFTTNGPIQKVTRTSNCTFTLTAPPSPATVILKMVHDGTGSAYTVTFSPVPKYPGGTAPTWTNTAAAIDIITFYFDGTTWYAVQQAAFA